MNTKNLINIDEFTAAAPRLDFSGKMYFILDMKLMKNGQQDKELTHLLHFKLNRGKKSAYLIASALFSNSVQLQVRTDVVIHNQIIIADGRFLFDCRGPLALGEMLVFHWGSPSSNWPSIDRFHWWRIRVYPFGIRIVMHESDDSIPFPGKGLYPVRKVPIKRCQRTKHPIGSRKPFLSMIQGPSISPVVFPVN